MNVLLVTGASRGIGAATALAAAKKGSAVCVNFNSDEAAASGVVAQIEADGGIAFAIKADISRESEVIRLFTEIDTRGQLAALVNNAGILERQVRIGDIDEGRLHRLFATNVYGTILCSREAVKRMALSNGGRGGSIVNLYSAASRIGSPGEYIDYAATKGAIDTFTLGLAKEVAREGIRVNAVRPGIIETDIHARGGDPTRIERLRGTIPMNRAGTADEIAAAILWLLSDAASYVTGSILDVAGGR
jgi:NAD(P)-dependent dehydrogenase (short-subunit alcohol dehydrogenase family)